MMVRSGVSFASNYWHQRIGMEYTQASLGDPIVQMESRRKQNHHLFERFRQLNVPAPETMRQNLDAVAPVVTGYGVATVPMMLGCEAVFSEAYDPYAKPLDLDDDAVMALDPETDFSVNPVMQDLEAQAAWLVKRHGCAKICINMQSVPNIAFKLRGDQLMFDFYENPEIVHSLLDYLQQTWINLRAYISRVNERNGCPDNQDMVSLDNCTVALLSPAIYRDFFLPYDQKTAARFAPRYGVHHCGDNMDLFASEYARLGEGIWFDLGYGSDVSDCMSKLKNGAEKPYWSLRYGPARLKDSSPVDIRRERDALLTCGADQINCVGVDPDTPEENLKAFLVP